MDLICRTLVLGGMDDFFCARRVPTYIMFVRVSGRGVWCLYGLSACSMQVMGSRRCFFAFSSSAVDDEVLETTQVNIGVVLTGI